MPIWAGRPKCFDITTLKEKYVALFAHPRGPEERFRLFASCLQKCLFRRFSFLCFLLVCGHRAALRGRGGRKKLPASGACPASLPDALRLPRPTNENQHKRGCRMSTFLENFHPMSRDVPQELIFPRTFFLSSAGRRRYKKCLFSKVMRHFLARIAQKITIQGHSMPKTGPLPGKKADSAPQLRLSAPCFPPSGQKRHSLPASGIPRAGRHLLCAPSAHRPPSPAQKRPAPSRRRRSFTAPVTKSRKEKTACRSWRCRAAASASIPAGNALPCA